MKQLHRSPNYKKHKKNPFLLIIITSAIMVFFGFFGYSLLTAYSSTGDFKDLNFLGIASNPAVMVDSVGNRNIKAMLLTPNPYSRPQTKLRKIKGVVIHYTANPGTDAEANRNYFENLKTNHSTYSSSHFVIGLKGEIIQCIPLNEISYASNNRNGDTISIECCHPEEDGEFTAETYESLIALTAWICKEYNLTEEDILRHHDVSGKSCPLYYVTNQEDWLKLKEDVLIQVSKLQ
jgi:N-acetyl-anhydromuramyl-L-alanine amidase AmpD